MNRRYLRSAVTGAALLACLMPFMAWSACSVSTTGVAFGGYDPFATQPLDSAGTVSVSCDVTTAYTIALGKGSGTYAPRTMLSGTHQLNYNLYVDASRAIVWGDGSSGTSTVAGSDLSANHTVYGRIPALQNVHIGSYADTLLVTVTF